jgi:hypothetical protein
MMKLIIAGGRNFDDYELLHKNVVQFLVDHQNGGVIILSGGADGADALGERFADEYGWEVDLHNARWNDLSVEPCVIKHRQDGTKYNVLAGLNRNTEMAKQATHCICFWDGKSTGTKDMIGKAKQYGLSLKVVKYKAP